MQFSYVSARTVRSGSKLPELKSSTTTRNISSEEYSSWRKSRTTIKSAPVVVSDTTTTNSTSSESSSSTESNSTSDSNTATITSDNTNTDTNTSNSTDNDANTDTINNTDTDTETDTDNINSSETDNNTDTSATTNTPITDPVVEEPVVEENLDSESVDAAQTAVRNIGTLKPIEGEDTNIVLMVQNIVDAVASEVSVGCNKSYNSQVGSNGEITYGDLSTLGNVSITLSKNQVSLVEQVAVEVPASKLCDTDADVIISAKQTLEGMGKLTPVEGTDANIIEMAQKIVDTVSNGVEVSLTASDNPQVAANGDIIFGGEAVTGSVTFALTKNNATDSQTIMVCVPSTLIIDQDAKDIAIAKAVLAEAEKLTPVEGTDANIIVMAQKIVDTVSNGVKVILTASDNPQVAANGDITFGAEAVTGSVTFALTKNNTSDSQSMVVCVPSTLLIDPDAKDIAIAKAVLVEAEKLTPVEGTDANIIVMAQKIVDTVSNGVKVTLTASDNPQVAANGDITFGAEAVTGSVTFALTKNNASDSQSMVVVVVAHKLVTQINVKDFGAKGDGVTDDTQAIQDAAIEARDKNVILYIPSGDYLVSDYLCLYTSVECEGTFIIQNSSDASPICIARSVSGVSISPRSLEGLTRGSSQIQGLNGYKGGTVVLKSSEVLIKRYDDGWGESYTKTDAATILSDDGMISPALDCTYSDLSKLTVKVYPFEEPIAINGLSVKTLGSTDNDGQMIKCIRSNVTINGLSFINPSTSGSPSTALVVWDCDNVNINNPNISGISGSGDKYGIELSNVSNVVINDGYITDAKHGITGRHTKNVVVDGGYYSGIDSHWGNNYKVENCTIDGGADFGIGYAGTDITIKNCIVKNVYDVFALRQDTPELMGDVVIENVTFSDPRADWGSFIFDASYNNQVLDYGRTLQVPDSVVMRNIDIALPSASYDAYYGRIYSNYRNLYDGKINPENITLVKGVGNLVSNFEFA